MVDPNLKRKRSPSPSDSRPDETPAELVPLNVDDGLTPTERDARHYRREALRRVSRSSYPFAAPTKAKPTRDPRPSDPRLYNPLDPVYEPPAPGRPGPINLTQNSHLPLPKGEVSLDVRLCYIVVGPAKRGKFQVQIADSLGVPKTSRAKLTGSGESVWVEDASVEGGKREVTPAMCLGKEVPATTTLVIDCPSPAHVEQLVANPIWDQYRTPNADGIYPVHVIWHRWGTWVNDERYQSWMAAFGPAVEVSGPRTTRDSAP